MSEADTQKIVLDYLKRHPFVAWAGRFNSGRKGNIRFNNVKGMPDIMGQLKDGRVLAIETKAENWKHPKDAHELEQAEFLENVVANNGVGFFANSIDSVINKIGYGLREE